MLGNDNGNMIFELVIDKSDIKVAQYKDFITPTPKF